MLRSVSAVYRSTLQTPPDSVNRIWNACISSPYCALSTPCRHRSTFSSVALSRATAPSFGRLVSVDNIGMTLIMMKICSAPFEVTVERTRLRPHMEIEKSKMILDQELISYRCSSCCCSSGSKMAQSQITTQMQL